MSHGESRRMPVERYKTIPISQIQDKFIKSNTNDQRRRQIVERRHGSPQHVCIHAKIKWDCKQSFRFHFFELSQLCFARVSNHLVRPNDGIMLSMHWEFAAFHALVRSAANSECVGMLRRGAPPPTPPF